MRTAGFGATPFATLTPDFLLDALDSIGVRSDGRLLALNSYENRVYQVFMEEGPPCVVKFYRAGRWSDAAILEEHAFSSELAARELPVLVDAYVSAEDGTGIVHMAPAYGEDDKATCDAAGIVAGLQHCAAEADRLRPFEAHAVAEGRECGGVETATAFEVADQKAGVVDHWRLGLRRIAR
mgnify:CR=1 FL=1